MSEENDLVQRVDALEVQVRAELRAHTSTLNALRETQLEQGRTQSQHSQILGEHSRVLNTVQVGVERIVELLTEPPAR